MSDDKIGAPVHYIPGDEGKEPQDRIALCLSGGGCRAMLFFNLHGQRAQPNWYDRTGAPTWLSVRLCLRDSETIPHHTNKQEVVE